MNTAKKNVFDRYGALSKRSRVECSAAIAFFVKFLLLKVGC